MLKPGETIDIWVVEKALGAGGMGSVYRCHNRHARRILAAVKVLESSIRRIPGAEERFIREAEILFSLDHPNIVKVRNVRTDLDPPYLEMEFVEGRSLEDMLREGAMPFDQATSVIAQLFDAIAYLHARGVRHRDVKPANLLVQSNGTLKLVDFGLAMEADTSRITQGTMAFGTVSYAPPEWVKPDQLDPMAWDAYAAGVVAYEVLTGDVAFPVSGGGSARQQAMQVILAKQGHPPLDPGPTFSRDLRNLIGRLTHSDAAHRLIDLDEARHLLGAAGPDRPRSAGMTLAPLPDEPTSEAPITAEPRGATWYEESTPQPAPKSMPPELLGSMDTAAPLPHPAGPADGSSSVLMALMGLTFAAVVIGLGGWAAWTFTRPPTVVKVLERPVAVTVSGLPPATPTLVRLRGIPPESHEGWVYRFGTTPHGPATVAIVVGADCPVVDCPGSGCPEWCAVTEQTVHIVDGEGEQSLSVEVAAPEAREVEVKAARGVTLAARPEVALDGALAPGRYQVLGYAGSRCPEDPWTCVDETCDDCEVEVAELIVPWQGEVAAFEHPLTPKARVTAPGPKPGPRPTGGGGAKGGLITHGAFARWLAKNPDWHKDAAVAAGHADANYLSGWSGIEPPAGKSGTPMVNISWNAAWAYCFPRGGLADVDAEPKTWSSGPTIEYRQKSGDAAWRMEDGSTSTAVKGHQSNGFTAARCKG